MSAVRINGTTVLVDNTGEDYDLMQDSPTQNYATGNPLDFVVGNPSPSFNFSKANLSGVGAQAGLYHGFASIAISADDTNTYYMEFSSPQASGGYPGAFIAQVGANPWWTDGLIWSAQSNAVSYNLVTQTPWTGATYTANAVAGFSYNGSTGVITGYVDGVEAGTFTADTGIDRVFGVLAPPQNITVMDFNYGQRPFVHQPDGTVALQTQNLPAAPIANGRDHFQAITGPGADILTDAQDVFDNGLWWIKDRANSNQHQFVDSFRPDNSALTCPERNTTPIAYDPPDGNSVAWCWSCPDTFTPAVTGGPTVNDARRNVEAGFSMIDSTAPNTGATYTIEHGLNAPVDFMLMKSRTSTSTWTVYHRSLGPTGRLRMDNAEAFQVNSAFFDDTDPDATNITLGSTFSNGDTSVLYAWASVPGYSAFGRYNGNATTNNSFVFTDFRPAWIMFKSIAAGGNWQIYDTTRSPHNPTRHFLSPNNTLAETAGFDIDILSNGFKIRASNGPSAAATGAVWCAFAENPFQAPVTSR